MLSVASHDTADKMSMVNQGSVKDKGKRNIVSQVSFSLNLLLGRVKGKIGLQVTKLGTV